ncbi:MULTISPECIES: MFS transporter [Anaeromyxobacter]|uniref:MFS transporter n=1 Tax=Anaeromyxobacter TaxID=161492 RepID=UPI001F58FCF6|nr:MULTISPECIES: MFS transporter [unclassified Anaeromyxobacter]
MRLPGNGARGRRTERETSVEGRPRLGRNVIALAVVSFLTDVSSEMIYPLLPLFLSSVLHASASAVGLIEGTAETTAALLKLASGWWSDRVRRRKPLVLLGYVISSFARPLVAVAQAASQVLVIRVVDRVGKGVRTSPRDALIADSVAPSIRGRAFGLHRAGDHAGAVVGPLIAFAILTWWTGAPLRRVFWLAAIPGVLSVLVLASAVSEVPREVDGRREAPAASGPLGRGFWRYLVVLLVFTLGNATDAFLLLRASQLGVNQALTPILWALLHVVKSLSSTPGGALSDRVGRKPLIVVGWAVYALVYFLFGHASAAWHAWALFSLYGVYFGLTEGAEKALVADLVPPDRRGAAFGWYNLAIGLGALPASVIFGLIWDRLGSPAAFAYGATLAFVAAVALLVVVPGRREARGR